MAKRRFTQNRWGISTIIETVIATAIIFTILALFYSSVNNLLFVHVRPDIDLEGKCQDIAETIISSPGLDKSFHLNWEDQTNPMISRLGLAATKTLAYGTYHDGTYDPPVSSTFDDDTFGGIVSSCFLADTHVIMASGDSKNIQDISVGELVKSYDPITQTYHDVPVLAIHHHRPYEMTPYYLIINDEVQVTPNHLLFVDNQWVRFDTLQIGNTIHSYQIHSIKRVYKRVPTYDLTVQNYHNYLVALPSHDLLVHNEVEWMPWIITSKDGKVDYEFEHNANRYYVEFTSFPPPGDKGIYEIKSESNFEYPVLDISKMNKLSTLDSEAEYEEIKQAFGLRDEFDIYDIHLTIRGTSFSEDFVYGATFDYADSLISVTRNVLIYHPPQYPESPSDYQDILSPFYESGQITVQLSLGGFIV